jgi:hypothetical protein
MNKGDQQLIENLSAADPGYATRLRAVPGKEQLVGEFTLDDLEDLLGHLAADANHAKDGKIQKRLDALYDRLLAVQRSYDDGNRQDSAG